MTSDILLRAAQAQRTESASLVDADLVSKINELKAIVVG